MDATLAQALFRPRGVALVGASGDPKKNTARPQRFLAKHGYAGKVFPINPGRGEVLGLPAYRSVAAAPGPVDHAFIMVPAKDVAATLRDCAAAGVRIATIYSDGFAEAGPDGVARQKEILGIARDANMRLLGPNSMGVVDCTGRTALTVNAALETDTLTAGTLGVVSQSGTVLGTLLSRGQARGVGFSKMISVGNESDLGVAELAGMLVDDTDTKAILLFLETIRDPAALAAMARRAFDARKPVIAYKLGRSEVGRAVAVSHSGAIAGSDEAVTAYCRAHAILRVDMLETLFEIAPLLIGRAPPAGHRVAVVTTTGGGAAMVADRLGSLGIDLARAPQSLADRLAPHGIRVGDGPLIDLTMAGARKEIYGAALEELLAWDGCDAIVAVVGSSAQFHPEVAVEPILGTAGAAKPVAAFLVPEAGRSLALLADAGIAAFRTPESCAEALRAYLDWRAPAAAPSVANVDLDAVSTILSVTPGPVLNEIEARAVFAALGIPQAPAEVLVEPDALPALPYPLAAKLISADLPHKTEAGAVTLNIPDEAAFRAAVAAMRARVAESHPRARIDGVLAQRMERGLAEVIVGYRANPETGPIVIVGAGGTLAELHKDAAIRLAPVDEATAREMIAEIRGLAPIRGWRNLPKGDLAALARVIAALSTLALLDGAPIEEAEINPLMVKAEGEGVVAVDGLVVLAAR